MNKTGSKILHGLLLATSGLVGSTLIASTAAMAGGGPTGGTVAVGAATIVNASPTQTVINQSSKKALINWNSFSIPAGSSVKFNQPNGKSLAVNRVTGPSASTIDGQLLANGNVWLINANGVLFGKGSQVNVGALLATTSDISDDDFKNGNYSFNAAANPNASVVNKGTITASRGGSVVLSAPTVSNEGLIQADLGTVVLGGAKAFTVDMTGDNLLRYEITAPVDSTPRDANGNPASALVSNSGTIMAAGGHVMMTARAARNIENNVINNTGMVEATTVSSHNGEIDLDAGPDGTANTSGTLDASGTAQGQTGGAVNVTGGTVNVADGAKIDVSGNAGGGTVQIGGGLHGQGTLAHAQRTIIGGATITADAAAKGNGGTVAVWSDGATSFAGSISAKGGAQGGNGGQVETSGHNLGVAASAKVDTSAPLGLIGDWLLDPTDLIISNCGSGCCGSTCAVSSSAIAGSLATTDVTESATNTLTLEAYSDITWNSIHSLTLLSGGVMTIGSSIQNAGSGNVTLIAGWDGSTINLASFSASSGAYGAAGGDIAIGGEYANGDIFVGSAHGITTVAGSNVTVSAIEGNATIGYGGVGGGDINVFAKNDISLAHIADDDSDEEGESALWASIGNGDGTTAGAVTGNITLIAGGNTEIVEGDDAYLGNFAANGSAATGNVTVITKSGNLDGGYFTDDLGSGAGSGGNVFIGFTGISGDYSFEGLGSYNSASSFTWAAAANLTVTRDTQNDGSGAVNLIAGWDGHTTNLGSLTNAGVYGNNQGVLTLDGTQGFNVLVGSKSGKTTALGYDVDLNANLSGGEGSVQIGYNDSGATGAIDVRAVRDISVLAGDSGTDCTECHQDTAYAQIGNGGAFVTGSESGAINVRAGGNITVSGGQNTFDFAQIGNGGDAGSANAGTSGDSGDIAVAAGGAITLTGGTDYAQIGNGGWGSNGSSGNITVTAAQNINLTAADAKPWGYAQIGDGGQTASGNISGNVQVNAGGALTLKAGNNNGMYAQIGNGADKAAGGGSNASGNITINAGSLSLVGSTSNAGTDSYAEIGNAAVFKSGISGSGVATGDININVTGATTFTSTLGQGHVWVGNVGANGGTETGAVSLLTGTLNSDSENNGDLRNFVVADVSGGNVTIGVESAGASINIDEHLDYTSANNLTLLTAGNLTISGGIQNAGSGNITLVTGWNPNIAPANVPGTAGSYGNGNTGFSLGGGSAASNSMVGSALGTTTVLTNNLNISAVQETAGLGFDGAASGNIVVSALGNVAMVGQSSNIFALIGNLGTGNQVVSGNVTVADAGSFTLTNGILGNLNLGGAAVSGNVGLTASSLAISGASVLSGTSAVVTLTGAGAGVGSASNPLLIDVNAVAVVTNNGNAYISVPDNGLSVGVGNSGIDLGTGNLTLA
ncbi:MAG: filamentous hemagglutinin N-terminal domain-containing protein, partial [Proteobacteria bacterium]|nr:filamentous hemagglutinin N-terminal domain-containing protein [Pseudomonadota bacterium]